MNLAGNHNIAIGDYAGFSYTQTGIDGGQLVAIGTGAGFFQRGHVMHYLDTTQVPQRWKSCKNAIGNNAGRLNTGSYVNVIGMSAGMANLASYVDLIGIQAGGIMRQLGIESRGDWIQCWSWESWSIQHIHRCTSRKWWWTRIQFKFCNAIVIGSLAGVQPRTGTPT